MAEKIWVVDNDPSPQYPIYTRGNIGEVYPEAVAPLSWTLGAIKGSEPGWRDAFARFGAFDADELPDELVTLGCFGGYGYLNVSLSRIFAVRTPGLTPELMDQSLFGTSEAPAYDPKPTDESPAHSERINATMGWVLTADSLPELLEDQRLVDDLVANRPDFTTLSNEEIIGWARSHMEQFRHLFAQHIYISYCATVPLGIIQGVTAAIGQPTLAMSLVSGLGNVDSAAPSWSLWDLSRVVRSNAALTRAFDDGVSGLEARIADEPEAATFRKAFDQFLDAFGSRGPNEWEMRAPTWGTHPELALAAIDRMRQAPDEANPQRHFDERHAEREAVTARVGEALAADPATQGQFLAACRASQIFLAGRERSKTTVIKFVHEARLGMHVLGARMVEAGHFDEVEDFGMLTDEEYDAFLADPASFKATIDERRAL
ncbi:MAG: rifampicin phosphotransferase, partial [Actinomycetota bacterium]|nr:rifampicin phosphotransferase [Actinomycetota bacterium]